MKIAGRLHSLDLVRQAVLVQARPTATALVGGCTRQRDEKSTRARCVANTDFAYCDDTRTALRDLGIDVQVVKFSPATAATADDEVEIQAGKGAYCFVIDVSGRCAIPLGGRKNVAPCLPHAPLFPVC